MTQFLRRKLHRLLSVLTLLICTGTAYGETVVFLPGLGVGGESFNKLIAELGPIPTYAERLPKVMEGDMDGLRSPFDVARYTRQQLSERGLTPPFIVVGHSVGGTHALAFAQSFPNETKAAVLIDPRLPWFDEVCIRAMQRGCGLPPSFRKKIGPRLEADYDGMMQDVALLSDMRGLGNMPVSLFVAKRVPRGFSPSFQTLWIDVARATTNKMQNGKLVILDGGHGLHVSHPEAIARAIFRGRLAN